MRDRGPAAFEIAIELLTDIVFSLADPQLATRPVQQFLVLLT
jgi:hypothetical protein